METTTQDTALRGLSDRTLDEITRSDVLLVLRRIVPQEDTPTLEVAAFNSSI